MATDSLEIVTDNVLLSLGKVAWGWELCVKCTQDEACASTLCPKNRVSKLQRYFQYYTALIFTYVDDTPEGSRPLKTHQDLHRLITQIKSNPSITRYELCQLIRASGVNLHLASTEIDQAITLAVQVLFMVDCSPLYQSSTRLEVDNFRWHWEPETQFDKYINKVFPTEQHPIFSSSNLDGLIELQSELRASNLKKELNLAFRATHDIRNHLKFNRSQNVLEVYHYTSFLKEQLRVTKQAGDFSTTSATITVGALPRQLVLETLDSLQTILFPLSDAKSAKLLRSLVCNSGFDPDIETFEFSALRNPGEERITYIYLADRLSELSNELHSPRPSGWLAKQIERKSGARYIMLATLIGIVFAVFLGILSLILSGFQAWVAYQAWKHPVVLPG